MSKLLDRYKNPQFLNYLARRLALHAKENILSSTNIDGGPMATHKRNGKPLISTGRMLRSITVDGARVEVNVPYAAEVQRKTGNRFVGLPREAVLRGWIEEYQDSAPE